MAKQGMNGPARPSGTVVPERRAAADCDDQMKGTGSPMGGTVGNVGFPISVPEDAFNIQSPSVTPGYRRPGLGPKG